MAIKNQVLTVSYYAWDTGESEGKTGDVAQHTIYVAIDGVANAADNSPAEVDATNLPGVYKIELTAAEMNGDHILVSGVSATADIIIVPISITTERGNLATIDTVVDTIQASTDNLPGDPASETNVNANETKIDAVKVVADAVQAKSD